MSTRMSRGEPISIQGFEVLTKLSSGGMGDVLLARRRAAHGFEKLVAVKTIRGDLAKRPDIRAMFLDEARLVGRLDHPAVAQVYDFGDDAGVLYLAMEYVAGIALNKLLVKRQAALPPIVAARIAAEACRGLHAAHQLTDNAGTPLGVVHRDVSPGNLILTFEGHVKILDFGIAFMHERESPDTQLGELKGKPSYMAPEQLRGERVDRRSDLFSLSVVLHEMLTGRKLFSKDNVVATALAVERGDACRPSELVADLDPALDAIVMRGLAKNAEDRFADAKVMATALDELIAASGEGTLESFVEAELSDEREIHRVWLQAVLSGEQESSGTYESFVPRPAAESGPHSPAPKDSITRDESARAIAVEARPLMDSTTLVPPAPTDGRGVRARRHRHAPALVSLALFALVVASFFGYRATQPQTPKPIPPIAPIAAPAVLAAPAPQEVAELPEGDPEEAPDSEAIAEDPVEPAAPTPTRRTTKRRRSAPRHAPAEVSAPAADTFGFLTIGATPYATVRINGRDVGPTPIMRRKMPTGRYEIQLLSPDTSEVRLKTTVDLGPEAHERITVP